MTTIVIDFNYFVDTITRNNFFCTFKAAIADY